MPKTLPAGEEGSTASGSLAQVEPAWTTRTAAQVWQMQQAPVAAWSAWVGLVWRRPPVLLASQAVAGRWLWVVPVSSMRFQPLASPGLAAAWSALTSRHRGPSRSLVVGEGVQTPYVPRNGAN